MNSLIIFLFSLKVAFCSCQFEKKRSGFRSGRSQYRIDRLGRMPAAVPESSGLAFRPGRRTFWTHNDSGGRPVLYEVSMNGTLVDSLPLPGIANTDWEALAAQDSTVLYVGDIGNNANSRPNLIIYRLNLRTTRQPEPISVRFANQTSFPATKDTRNFDSEALLFARDSLFLLSKNRSRPRRPVSLYGFPAEPGNYALTPRDSVWIKSMVTDASVSPDRRTLAVLTYGKVLLFDLPDGEISFRHPARCLRLPRGQTEAISFVNSTDFVMTNEQGRIYLVRRKTRPSAKQRATPQN